MFKGYDTCFHFTSKTYNSNYTNQKEREGLQTEGPYHSYFQFIICFWFCIQFWVTKQKICERQKNKTQKYRKTKVKDKRTKHKNIEIRFKTLFEI